LAEALTGPLGPLVAIFAGLLSFVSPCVLPLVPIYIAHLAGNSFSANGEVVQVRSFTLYHALAFVLGFSVVFILLGASVGLVGYLFRDQIGVLTRVAGVVLVVFGLQFAGILKIPWLERSYVFNVDNRGVRSFSHSAIVGAAFSVGWTPCIGPILGSILTLAATSATVGQGAYLLVFYSLGLGVPFLIVGAALGSATIALKRLYRFMPAITRAGGLMIVAMGVVIFLDRFTMFNRYFDFFGLGAGI
jgi:cytochrome c-type biogenesis protein